MNDTKLDKEQQEYAQQIEYSADVLLGLINDILDFSKIEAGKLHIEEIDFDSWNEMELKPIEPPEDWSGSLDIVREDYGVDLELTAPNDQINPLDELE